jgi:hypothetical protein
MADVKKIALLLAPAAVLLGSAGAPAEARPQDYPWCMEASIDVRDCSFTSWAQCMATARGIAGNCSINMSYQGPAEPARPKSRRPRKKS